MSKYKVTEVEKITLTVNDLTKMLGVSQGTIYTMCRENQIPHFKVRGRILFNKDVIMAWTRGEHENAQQVVNE